nr:hypothetical protein [uncultured Niameybacter sp.]
MKQELLEIVRSLEFDEIEDVLKGKMEQSQINLFLKEEAKRRCQITVDEIQQQLNYLLNTELTVEEIISDVLCVLEGADLAIDIQNPFILLEEVDGEVQGMYPYFCEGNSRRYCGGLIGITIQIEDINENLESGEYGYSCNCDEEDIVIQVADINIYYVSQEEYCNTLKNAGGKI